MHPFQIRHRISCRRWGPVARILLQTQEGLRPKGSKKKLPNIQYFDCMTRDNKEKGFFIILHLYSQRSAWLKDSKSLNTNLHLVFGWQSSPYAFRQIFLCLSSPSHQKLQISPVIEHVIEYGRRKIDMTCVGIACTIDLINTSFAT